MKRLIFTILIAIGISSCTKPDSCEIHGRWVVEAYPNTLYEFTDSLQYTIYSTAAGSFGTIADAIPNPHEWVMDGDTIDIDLNFGNHLRAYPAFDCDCRVLDLISPAGTTTLVKEGFDISECR